MPWAMSSAVETAPTPKSNGMNSGALDSGNLPSNRNVRARGVVATMAMVMPIDARRLSKRRASQGVTQRAINAAGKPALNRIEICCGFSTQK